MAELVKMAEQALPTDILREIGAHWAGHRLHYTCSALYVSWRPENYITIAKVGGLITSCMPNGVYHGNCTALGKSYEEITEYDRGHIARVTFASIELYYTEIIINGQSCRWVNADGGALADMHDDLLGLVTVSENLQCIGGDFILPKPVTLRDFNAAARAAVAQP